MYTLRVKWHDEGRAMISPGKGAKNRIPDAKTMYDRVARLVPRQEIRPPLYPDHLYKTDLYLTKDLTKFAEIVGNVVTHMGYGVAVQID